MTLNCLVCGKQLLPAMTLTEDLAGQLSPPHGGTRFTSRGNYGSFFDPINDREFMELNICNACLLLAAEQGRIAYGLSSVAVHVEYQAFDVEAIKATAPRDAGVTVESVDPVEPGDSES